MSIIAHAACDTLDRTGGANCDPLEDLVSTRSVWTCGGETRALSHRLAIVESVVLRANKSVRAIRATTRVR
jgi:hypothetical protein